MVSLFHLFMKPINSKSRTTSRQLKENNEINMPVEGLVVLSSINRALVPKSNTATPRLFTTEPPKLFMNFSKPFILPLFIARRA